MLNEVVSKLSTEFSKAFIDKFTKQFSGHLERISEGIPTVIIIRTISLMYYFFSRELGD